MGNAVGPKPVDTLCCSTPERGLVFPSEAKKERLSKEVQWHDMPVFEILGDKDGETARNQRPHHFGPGHSHD